MTPDREKETRLMPEEPYYTVEDERSLIIDEPSDRDTILVVLGHAYTYRELADWSDFGAHVYRYESGERSYVGAVDDILDRSVRPRGGGLDG